MKNNNNANEYDAMIAGAGASGLFCAMILAKRGLRIALVESGPQCGRKLAISGGGYANFSNRHISPKHYVCNQIPDFCAKALRAFTLDDFINLVEHWRLPWEERPHGRLFLRCPAKNLVGLLVRECAENGCHIYLNEKIKTIKAANGLFSIFTSKRHLLSRVAVLALGSPCRPSLGASGAGWRIAKALGHAARPPIPVLTPLLYAKDEYPDLRALSGISLPVKITLPAPMPDLPVDDLLFTHSGLSGPAMLQASLYWKEGDINIDFLPGGNFEKLLDDNPRSTPRGLLRELLPIRLADALLPREIRSHKNGELSRDSRKVIARGIHSFAVGNLSRGSLDMAEICAGGVNVDEIESASMESKIHPRLYILGETLDVAGRLGGYNLHWAFASAFCAAENISAKIGQEGVSRPLASVHDHVRLKWGYYTCENSLGDNDGQCGVQSPKIRNGFCEGIVE